MSHVLAQLAGAVDGVAENILVVDDQNLPVVYADGDMDIEFFIGKEVRRI